MTLLSAATLTLMAAAVACPVPTTPSPSLPDGPHLSADGVALRRLLQQIERLEPARIATKAVRARSAVAHCGTVRSRPSEFSLELLLAGLECDDDEEVPDGISVLRERADLVLSVPRLDGGHFVAEARISPDGGVDASLQVPIADSGPWSLLVPASGKPGPAILSTRAALVHVRTRASAKLNIANLVSPGSQGDQLFGLRSSLFAGALLDGRIELALYPPHNGHVIPPTALALGVTLAPAAREAMSAYVDHIEAAWTVHRSPLRIGDSAGLCLTDLNTAPDLAPCYVATDDALILGWNAASLKLALSAPPSKSSGGASDGAGSLRVQLDRLPAADAVLAESWGGEAGTPVSGYPWKSLAARSKATEDGVEVSITLEAAPKSSGAGDAP